MNESAEGRDGYILAMGRRLYHVYKQDFPMEFWYGLTPDANRECSDGPQIDVRTLPEKYRQKPVEIDWSKIQRRSIAKAMRQQLKNHALAFANAMFDNYSLEEHAQREHDRALAEWAEHCARRDAIKAERAAINACVSCGMTSATVLDECDICAEIPF